ncbi:hypothetical protein TrRE_jg9225 [Triparma retinervis]|uniref:DNA endonuclease activator Ctp1 C-terminal domain-containing protein n=1 Tax=Triparma retinervis TaxID=2557542 RepID=A0A9W7L635_9STRA|nr:hypothetical protein TrRE_jg9225 [Triparma retinervis]
MDSTSVGGSRDAEGEEILCHQLQILVRSYCERHLNEIDMLRSRVKELEDEKGALVAKLHKWKKGLGVWVERTLHKYGGKINPADLPDLNEGSQESNSSQSQKSSHSTVPESLPGSDSCTRKPLSSQESEETMIGSAGIRHDYDVGLGGLSYEENLDDVDVGGGKKNMDKRIRGQGDGEAGGGSGGGPGRGSDRGLGAVLCREVGAGAGTISKAPTTTTTFTTTSTTASTTTPTTPSSARRALPANPYATSSRPPSNFSSNPYANSGGTKFKEVVRGKEARKRMHGQICEECRLFFEAVAKDSNGVFDAESMVQSCSRHKTNWKNATQTPPDFWEMDFIDERENEENEGNRFTTGLGGVVLETPVKQPIFKRKSRGSSSEKKKRKHRKTPKAESKRMKFTADSQED